MDAVAILPVIFVIVLILLVFNRNRVKLFIRNFTASSTQASPHETLQQSKPSSLSIIPDVPTIFLSYRRSDSNDISGRIYDRLIQALPRESVFKDVDSIPFGIDFREYLAEMIQKCDIVLAVIGSDWIDVKDSNGRRRLDDSGDFVRIEIEEALQRKIRVIPLLVRGASMPQEIDLPDRLKPLAFRNGISVRPDPDFHNDMNRLLRDLNLLK